VRNRKRTFESRVWNPYLIVQAILVLEWELLDDVTISLKDRD